MMSSWLRKGLMVSTPPLFINIKNKRLGVILRSKPLFYLKIEL